MTSLLVRLAGVLTALIIILPLVSHAFFLRDRQPERYRGVWRYLGTTVGNRGRALMIALGLIVGTLISGVATAELHLTMLQLFVFMTNGLFLFIAFVAIAFSIAVYQLRQRIERLEQKPPS